MRKHQDTHFSYAAYVKLWTKNCKLEDYPELERVISKLLFNGEKIVYNPDLEEIDIAIMFGFAKCEKAMVVIANRIFETRLYNRFIVDYHGEQFLIEMKIWYGKEYHKRGEAQLVEYLESYHRHTGYMLSFNFNKKKEVGVFERMIGDK